MENFKELNNITNCKECFWYTRCKQYGENINKVCNDFDPLDVDTYCANIESYLKEHNKPSNKHRMTIRAIKDTTHGITYDCDSLNNYYVQMINDDIKVLKSGGTAYVFKISQIKDLMRYLPDLHIETFDEGIYYLSL